MKQRILQAIPYVVIGALVALYIMRPRMVSVEHLVEAIPDTIRINMPTLPPEVVTKIDTYIVVQNDTVFAEVEHPILHSTRTFHKRMLYNDKEYAHVQSAVGVYSNAPILGMYNQITIIPNKYTLDKTIEEYTASQQGVPWKGYAISALGGITIGLLAHSIISQ